MRRRVRCNEPVRCVHSGMLAYPATITRNGSEWLIRFRDIPEAIAGGDTRQEVLSDAFDALATAMEFYFEDEWPVPKPSERGRFEVMVELDPIVAEAVRGQWERAAQD